MSGGSTSGQPPTSANLGNGITITAPPASSAGSTSPYGLTNGWEKAQINVSGFPLAIVNALHNAGLDMTQPVTGDQVAAALAKITDRGVVAQVQQMLLYGGFYPSTVTNTTDLQLGRFQGQDITALKNLIQAGGQTGQPLGSYLVSSANFGMAQGTINKVAGVGVKPIPIPADADIDTALRAAAAKEIGHDPSPELLAGFRAMYDQMLVSASKQAQALAQQSTANGLGDPNQIGAAAGRLGLDGYFGDQAERPPTPAPPMDLALPSTQGPLSSRDTALTAEQNGQQASANYLNQHIADQATVARFGSTIDNNLAGSTPTLTSAPNINVAADAYLQQNAAADVGAQTLAGKYSTLLSILGGTGK